MSNEGDFGETELDPAEQAEADLNLDDPSAGDDEPWTPPERQPRGAEFVDVEDETLSVRVLQEEPDVGEETDERMLGGDDPDAIPADLDVLGGDADEDESFDLDGDPGPESRAMHVEE